MPRRSSPTQATPNAASTARHVVPISCVTSNGSPQSVRIVVVDDHQFMRELISSRLARDNGRFNVIGEEGDARSAIKACDELAPDLLILDINLPDLSGIEAVPHIRKVSPNTRILLCTAFVSDDRVIDALRSGAQGFVEKTNTWGDFIEAVERVSRGEQFFRAQSSPALSDVARVGKEQEPAVPAVAISTREKEILTLVAEGDTSKEIASKLHISIGTVDTHRNNLMKKLNVRNVAGLVVYAFRVGLIRLPATG